MFYGCEGYPECDFVSWQKPSDKKCPKCGGYMIEKGSKLVCADETCGYVESKNDKEQQLIYVNCFLKEGWGIYNECSASRQNEEN